MRTLWEGPVFYSSGPSFRPDGRDGLMWSSWKDPEYSSSPHKSMARVYNRQLLRSPVKSSCPSGEEHLEGCSWILACQQWPESINHSLTVYLMSRQKSIIYICNGKPAFHQRHPFSHQLFWSLSFGTLCLLPRKMSPFQYSADPDSESMYQPLRLK